MRNLKVVMLFLIGAVTFGNDSNAAVINFDDVSIAAFDFAPRDHYQTMGAIFSRDIPIANVSASAFGSTFLAQGGTAPNGMSISVGVYPDLFIDLTFDDPIGGGRAVTDSLSIDAYDTEVGSTLATISLFDIHDSLIGGGSLETPASEHGLFSFSVAGIARARIATDGDGAIFDNLAFGALTPVPEPMSLAAFSIGLMLLGLLRRKRAAG